MSDLHDLLSTPRRLADLAETAFDQGGDWDGFHNAWVAATDEDKRTALIIAADRAARAVAGDG